MQFFRNDTIVTLFVSRVRTAQFHSELQFHKHSCFVCAVLALLSHRLCKMVSFCYNFIFNDLWQPWKERQ